MKTVEELRKISEALSHIYAHFTVKYGERQGERTFIKTSGSVQALNPEILVRILSSLDPSDILRKSVDVYFPYMVYDKIISELNTFIADIYNKDPNSIVSSIIKAIKDGDPDIKEAGKRFLNALGSNEEERMKAFDELVKDTITRAVELLKGMNRKKKVEGIVTFISIENGCNVVPINDPALINLVKVEFIVFYYILSIISKRYVNKSVSEIAEDICEYYKQRNDRRTALK